MCQKPYIKMRPRTSFFCFFFSLWAELPKTSRMIMRWTWTFFENFKQKNPPTSHEWLLTCSQVKANVTETLHINSFANFLVSRARENIKNSHDGNTMMQQRTTQHDRSRIRACRQSMLHDHLLNVCLWRRKTIRAFKKLIRWSFESVCPWNRSDDHVIPCFCRIGPMSI